MITLGQLDDLPTTVSQADRLVLDKMWSIQDTIPAESFWEWGCFAGMLLRFHRELGNAQLTVHVTVLGEGQHAPLARTSDQLWALVRSGPPAPAAGQYFGMAVLAETLTVPDDTGLPHLAPPGALGDLVDDMVAAGTARQGLTTIGVLPSGWTFALASSRHDPTVTLALWEPDEPDITDWIAEVLRPLRALHRILNP